MSRIRVCLFVLSLVLGIAVQFGNCENNTTDCAEGKNANNTDETSLSKPEKIFRDIINPIENIIKIFSKPKNNTSNIKESFGKVLNKIADNIHIIFPGTLWCGSGDIAKKEKDLGLFNKTDACCRSHDNCQNDILPGDTEGNLKNNGIFTRSACICDFEFYNCLKKVNTIVSYKIGIMYFNILGPQCFKCECPTPECNLEDNTECKGQCNKYKWINNNKY